MSYVTGLGDGLSVGAALYQGKLPFCADQKVTTGQIMRVMEKWMKERPESTHLPLPALYLKAMVDSFRH